jgi:hypothetical protein
MALICFAVVTLVGAAAYLTVVLIGPAGSLTDLGAGIARWLAWLVAVPLLGVVSARRGNPSELLAGYLGAVLGAVGVIEVPGVLERLPSGDVQIAALTIDALTIAALVGVPFLVVGGLTLVIARARAGHVRPEAPTR